MNELITSIFKDFTVDGVLVPVKFMIYQGHGEPYVVWSHIDSDGSFSGDDDLLGYIDYFDFDIYSKGNYLSIVEAVKTIMRANGFVFQPSRSSADLYETDTGYYHRTLTFAIYKEETTNG